MRKKVREKETERNRGKYIRTERKTQKANVYRFNRASENIKKKTIKILNSKEDLASVIT